MKLSDATRAVLISAAVITLAFIGLGYWSQTKAAEPWTGCSVGGTIGAAITKTELSVGGSSIDGLGGDGVTAGVNAGCDLQIERFVIGAFAQYHWTDGDFKALNAFTIGETLFGKFTVGLDESWAIGARAGILITPRTLAYGLVGYTEAKASSNLFTIPDLKGYVVGGGMETMITMHVSLKLEYQYSKFDAVSIATDIGPISLEPVNHTVMVGASYKFGDVPALPK